MLYHIHNCPGYVSNQIRLLHCHGPHAEHYWRKNPTTQNYATHIFIVYKRQLSALLRNFSRPPRWAPTPTVLTGILMVAILLPNSFDPRFWRGPLFCFGEHNDNLNFETSTLSSYLYLHWHLPVSEGCCPMFSFADTFGQIILWWWGSCPVHFRYLAISLISPH